MPAGPLVAMRLAHQAVMLGTVSMVTSMIAATSTVAAGAAAALECVAGLSARLREARIRRMHGRAGSF
jgi:hypothetical protein